jgi:hypothetical protein
LANVRTLFLEHILYAVVGKLNFAEDERLWLGGNDENDGETCRCT